jgi:hypothetical protein
MAIAQGFGKTTTNNLIFSYDTGDMDNSFKGAPKTNLLSSYGRTYGNQSSSVFKTQYYSRDVFVPTLGVRTVETIETYNDYGGGSGVCCQQAWSLGGSSVSGSTQYAYSIIYRSSSGYTHPNFMYRYEYGASGYITEGGLHNDGNRTHLGDGWYHAWGNLTTQPGTTTMYFYFYMYEYATYNTIDIAGVMFTQGPEVLRPRQFIPFGTTRSVTQGLLDLTGNRTVNLSTVSFNSTGQMTFDGTDDTLDTGIPLTTLSALSNFTIECTVKIDAYPAAAPPNGYGSTTKAGVLVGATYYSGTALYWYGNSDGTACTIYAYIRGADAYRTAGAFDLTPGRYHHLVLVNDASSGSIKLYANGSLNGSAGTATQEYNPGLTPTAGNIGINKAQVDGGGTQVYSHLPCLVPIAKIYSRALTASEIEQNYRHYKTRFNL